MADETPVPIEGEYAVDARARGCVVPDDVPPEARWAKQHLHSLTYDTPRWLWMKLAPLRWQRDAAKAGIAQLVFTCSWSDWFIKEADPWRDEAWAIVKKTPNMIYQILTKRPSRILKALPTDWGTGYPNVWLGVSAEDQDAFDRRTPLLAAVPASVRFVSVEPQLGPVSIRTLQPGAVDWIIYGGESGNEAESRFFDPAWARLGIGECRERGIIPYVKQMGSVWARANPGTHPHGANPAEWDADLRVQEFPAGFVRSTARLPSASLTILSG